jgi:Zn-dependent protease/predicted transcriptional regulator
MSGGGISIGKMFGIPVKLHYSWFLVFALVAWSLAAEYFPATYPGWDLTTSIVASVITSLLFFGSVLAHELMHSVVARSEGIPIQGITLFIFGGVSQMTEEPRKPEDEFRMAIAGPLTSLALGVIFLAIWFFLKSLPQVVIAIAFWLGWINVTLAGFNLVPGFPLDGGRVLRSLLWWRSQNIKSATKVASTVGRVIGYLFISAGIWIVFQGNWFNGIWLAMIGWFLESAASGSYKQLALQEMLKGHRVTEVMTTDCPTVFPELTIEQLVHDNMLTSGRRCFPVVQRDGSVQGLVTLNEIAAVPRVDWLARTVKEIMTPFSKLKTVRPDEDLATVMQMLAEQNINQVLVVKDGNIMGMVARDNLINFINLRGELGIK